MRYNLYESIPHTIYDVLLKAKLGDIVDIRVGYQPKGKVEPDENSPYRIIQIKDFDDDQNLLEDDITLFRPDRNPAPYFLEVGDILTLSRGQRNWSVSLDKNIDNTVAVAFFFVLRPYKNDLVSSYLAWYLNQVPAQSYLTQIARRGSHMQVITKATFLNLPVEIPSIRTQKNIAELDRLVRMERTLMCRIGDKRDELIRAISLRNIEDER